MEGGTHSIEEETRPMFNKRTCQKAKVSAQKHPPQEIKLQLLIQIGISRSSWRRHIFRNTQNITFQPGSAASQPTGLCLFLYFKHTPPFFFNVFLSGLWPGGWAYIRRKSVWTVQIKSFQKSLESLCGFSCLPWWSLRVDLSRWIWISFLFLGNFILSNSRCFLP